MHGGSWALLARALAVPAGLATAVLLARFLSPEELGSYFLVMSLVGLLAITAQAGLARPMVKLIAAARARGQPGEARHALEVALVVTALGLVVIGLVLPGAPGRWLVGHLEAGRLLRTVLDLAFALTVILALSDLVAESMRGFERLGRASFLSEGLAQRLGVTVVLVLLWALGHDLDLRGALLIGTWTGALVLCVALLLLWQEMRRLPRGRGAQTTVEVLRHGPPFFVVRLNLWLMAGADLWVLGMFRPAEEVALYGAASRLALLIRLPLVASNAILAPVVAELHQQRDPKRLERVIRAAATAGTLPALLAALLLVLTGDLVLRTVFTDAYGAAWPIMVILAVGQCVHAAFGACNIALTMTGHQRDVMVIGPLVSVGTVLALLLVAPAAGGTGVAAVVTLSLAAYNVLLARAAYQRLGLRTWATLSPEVLRSIGSIRRPARRAP
ncbi:MAG TPA: oligosaccharide flippase family protein [Geminicoccaceae bacterium]